MDLSSDDIASAIQTRHVLTDIQGALTFTGGEPQSKAAATLRTRDFDNAPVRLGGSIAGYVGRDDLDPNAGDPVEEKLRRLDESMLVSADAPLGQLMNWLSSKPLLFVVEHHQIVGLVTPSDLNKQPGRTYFYLLIAGLETALADLIRSYFPDQAGAVSLLPEHRRKALNKRRGEQRDADVFADEIAAMYFTDLLDIVEASHHLRRIFTVSDEGDWRGGVREPLRRLRNQAMHPVKTLVRDRDGSLKRLTEMDVRLRDLLGAAHEALATSPA